MRKAERNFSVFCFGFGGMVMVMAMAMNAEVVLVMVYAFLIKEMKKKQIKRKFSTLYVSVITGNDKNNNNNALGIFSCWFGSVGSLG